MRRFVVMAACLGAGLVVGGQPGLADAESRAGYAVLLAVLLAVGLYASTHGISLVEARRHWKLIVVAVTVGVLVKAALIGGVLVVAFGDQRFWILGIAVAQIDPLAVASLMTDERVSARAKTILGAWSSFDDPMTVLLALYLPVLVSAPLAGHEVMSGGPSGYLAGLGANVALAAVVGAIWWLVRRRTRSPRLAAAVGYVLLAASFVAAVGWLLMAGLALIGLLLRPPGLARRLDRAVSAALLAAVVLVGMQMADGIDLAAGIALGGATFAAQIVVGTALTWRLPRADRRFIALAQQNGITAIILALLLEPAYPGTVAVVMPAVVTVNLLHAAGRRFAPAPVPSARVS